MSAITSKLVLNKNGVEYLSQGDRAPNLNIEYFVPMYDNNQNFDAIDILSESGEVGTVKNTDNFFTALNLASDQIDGELLFNRGYDQSNVENLDRDVRYLGKDENGTYTNYLVFNDPDPVNDPYNETSTNFPTTSNSARIQKLSSLDNSYLNYKNKFSTNANVRAGTLFVDNFFRFSNYRPNAQYQGSQGNQAISVSGQFEGPIRQPSVYRNFYYNKIALFTIQESVYFQNTAPTFEGPRQSLGGIRKSPSDNTRYKEPVFLGVLYYGETIPSGILPESVSASDINYNSSLTFLNSTIRCRVASQLFNEADLKFDVIQSTSTGFTPIVDPADPAKSIQSTPDDLVIVDSRSGFDGNFQSDAKLTIFSNATDKSILKLKDSTGDKFAINYRSIDSGGSSTFATEMVTEDDLPFSVGNLIISGTIGTFDNVINIGDNTFYSTQPKDSGVSIGHDNVINRLEDSVSIGNGNQANLVDAVLIGNSNKNRLSHSDTVGIGNDADLDFISGSVYLGNRFTSDTTFASSVMIGNSTNIDTSSNSVIIGNKLDINSSNDSIVIINDPLELGVYDDDMSNEIFIKNIYQDGAGNRFDSYLTLSETRTQFGTYNSPAGAPAGYYYRVDADDSYISLEHFVTFAGGTGKRGFKVTDDKVTVFREFVGGSEDYLVIDNDARYVMSFQSDEIEISDSQATGAHPLIKMTSSDITLAAPFSAYPTILSYSEIKTGTLSALTLNPAENFIVEANGLTINASNKLEIDLNTLIVPITALPAGTLVSSNLQKSYGRFIKWNDTINISTESNGTTSNSGVTFLGDSTGVYNMVVINDTSNAGYFNAVTNDKDYIYIENNVPVINGTPLTPGTGSFEWVNAGGSGTESFIMSYHNFQNFGSRITQTEFAVKAGTNITLSSDKLLLMMTMKIDLNALPLGYIQAELLNSIQQYYSNFGALQRLGLVTTTPIKCMILPGRNNDEINIFISLGGGKTAFNNLLHPNLYTIPSINLYNDYGLGYYGK